MNIEDSSNFRRITENLTTSGILQPEALNALREQGYDVVNLLPSDEAIANEQDIVEGQGLEYISIPVDWKHPTASDFSAFWDALNTVQDKKVHVHCAANYRVSAFTTLYLVRRGSWTVEQAMTFIHSIWQPSEYSGWSDFIAGILDDTRS